MIPDWLIAASMAAALGAIPVSASASVPDNGTAAVGIAEQEPLTAFAPRPDGREDRLDYSVWTEALAAFIVSMGPPLRKMPPIVAGPNGTRIQIGHNSIYRLDGAMVGFSFIDNEVLANIARYRRELEAVADTVGLQALPRNEQLAYWLNLHNVALVEQIGANWPIRQPREIMVDGAPLDDARFITVQGVALSPRDIRERIIYANWQSPEVIYGFWRGEIGGPAIQRSAFDGREVSNQLARAAREFANSRRGTQKRRGTLHVSRFYAEAAPFFFRDFNADLRRHLAHHGGGAVAEMLANTTRIEASLYEYDIADLSGGRRANAFFATGRVDPGTAKLLAERQRKLDYAERTQPRTGTITFSNITLPGDPPNKDEVE